jgi:chromosomal replication initiator protein
VLYLSGERFMNEYIHAIRTNRMHEFRRRYREGCDVLLVDDVQFLAGKDGTQDEFFHTFNALHEGHRQIVLTADRKPHEISDIADRLRTRFAWGLLADIEPPELEVRVAILRKKAAAEAIQLPDDVALYIASAIKSNVRELEGALIRLAAYASLSRREIALEFAREILEGSITRPAEHLSVDHVLKAVASYYGVKVTDLKSPRRHKSVAGPPYDRHLGGREGHGAYAIGRGASWRDPRHREPPPPLKSLRHGCLLQVSPGRLWTTLCERVRSRSGNGGNVAEPRRLSRIAVLEHQ